MKDDKKRQYIEKIKIIKNKKILLFAILPIVALGVGYALSKFVIIPAYYTNINTTSISSKETNKEETNAGSKTTKTRDKTTTAQLDYVHNQRSSNYLQLGSFSTKENAEEFCNTLKAKNIPCVIKDEGKFLVLTGGAFEENTTNKIKEHLDKNEIEFFNKVIDLPSWNIPLPNKDEKENLEQQILSLYEFLDQCLDYIWTTEKKDEEKMEFLSALNNLKEAIKAEVDLDPSSQQWGEFAKELGKDLKNIQQQSEDIHKLYQTYNKILENLIKVHNSLVQKK